MRKWLGCILPLLALCAYIILTETDLGFHLAVAFWIMCNVIAVCIMLLLLLCVLVVNFLVQSLWRPAHDVVYTTSVEWMVHALLFLRFRPGLEILIMVVQ